MWEEDPRWQEANYRFLINATGVATILVTVWCWAFREWEFLGYWYTALAAIVAALCIYAAVVWVIGHSVRALTRLVRWFVRRHRRDD